MDTFWIHVLPNFATTCPTLGVLNATGVPGTFPVAPEKKR